MDEESFPSVFELIVSDKRVLQGKHFGIALE